MAYLYLAKQIGIAGAFALWAYLVAKGLFARTPLRLSFVQEVALLVPVGLGVAILLLFGLGIAGYLTAPGIVVSAGLGLALSCWRLRGRIAPAGASGTIRAIASAATPARLAMIAISCTVLLPVALRALTPPIVSDEVRYHLPYALHFVEQGRLVPDLYLRFPFFTLNVNLLYAAALVFGDDVTPHFVHLLLGALAGLALYALAVPGFGRVTAFGAVLLFFATPIVARFASTAYIDLGLAAFVTAAIASLDRSRGRPALVVCAGLAFGAALGTKYLALAFLPLLVAWAAYRTRQGREVARFAAVAVLTGAPWYVYNVVWTGNPVSPFAGEWFPTWPWTAEDLAGQVAHLAKRDHDPSLIALLSLPWHLATDSWRFSTSTIPILLVPGVVALALLPWWDRRMRPYGVLVLIVVTVWFFTAAYFRYLTAILPLWCLMSAWSLQWILRPVVSLMPWRRSAPGTAGRRASYAAAAIVVALTAHHWWREHRWLNHDAVTERVVHRDRYLRKRLPVYGVVEHLRQSKVRDEVIFVFPPGALLSYVRDNRIIGDHFGLMGRRQTFARYVLCKGRLVEKLRREGVSRLVTTQKFLDRWPDWKSYLASRLTSEYADRHATVFRIVPGAEPPSASRQQGSGHPQRVPAQDDAVAPRLPHLTAGDDATRIIPYLPAVSDGSARALVRIVNQSDRAGTVVIHGTDAAGATLGPVAVELEARRTRYFDSASMAACDLAQEMDGGLEESTSGGMWLSLIADFDIESMAYVRTEDGFVTSMHEVAGTTHDAAGGTAHEVPFFNPGSNRSQVSSLRLVNTGRRDIEVAVAGRDDAGVLAAEAVRVALPAGAACRLGAQGLESGDTGADDSTCEIVGGRLGNGQGRWRFSVTGAGGDLQVMSLLANPTGHLTNLSVSGGDGGEASVLPLVLPVPGSGRGPQGFVRVVNDSGEAGTVDILGLDDTGVSHGPITLALDEYEAVELDSLDLEAGNASKDLPEGLGDGEGYWRLKLATGLDVKASAYVRTGDGFVASLHGIVRRMRDNEVDTYHVPYFDFGKKTRGNRSRIASSLRLINSGPETVEVAIEGSDRTGTRAPEGAVSLVLPARQACKLSAKEVETGEPDPGSGRCTGERFSFDGRFGEVTRLWSLSITAAGGDIQVMSLMESPDGYLANLSAAGRRRSP